MSTLSLQVVRTGLDKGHREQREAEADVRRSPGPSGAVQCPSLHGDTWQTLGRGEPSSEEPQGGPCSAHGAAWGRDPAWTPGPGCALCSWPRSHLRQAHAQAACTGTALKSGLSSPWAAPRAGILPHFTLWAIRLCSQGRESSPQCHNGIDF